MKRFEQQKIPVYSHTKSHLCLCFFANFLYFWRWKCVGSWCWPDSKRPTEFVRQNFDITVSSRRIQKDHSKIITPITLYFVNAAHCTVYAVIRNAHKLQVCFWEFLFVIWLQKLVCHTACFLVHNLEDSLSASTNSSQVSCKLESSDGGSHGMSGRTGWKLEILSGACYCLGISSRPDLRVRIPSLMLL